MTPIPEHSVGDLIKELRNETTTLVRDEIALAKTETKEKVTVFGRNAVTVAIGGLIGYSALVILFLAIGSLITEAFVDGGMDPAMAHFLGLAIVAGVAGLISAGLLIKGIKRLKRESVVPRRTVETLKNDREFIKQQVK